MSDDWTSEPPPKPEPKPQAAWRPAFACLRCRGPLDVERQAGEGPSKCPRCGLPFDPDRPETYLDEPRRPPWQVNLAALMLAVAIGALTFAIIRQSPTMGAGLFFGVPFAVGALIGFTSAAGAALSVMLGIVAVLCLACTLVFLNFAGIFCGLTLGAIFLGPAMAGVIVGWLARAIYVGMTSGRRRYDVFAMFLGVPFGVDGLERRWPLGTVVREVRTEAVFDAPADRAWDAIQFYEQVEHPPPFLLTLALPRPVRAEGCKDAVGAEQKCLYRRGYLVKRITRREPPRVLAFDVVEQHLHFEHDVELRDGSFVVEPTGEGRCRVVLSTRYRRLLRPAWLWEPMERAIIRTLHGHVLEGMRRHAGDGR